MSHFYFDLVSPSDLSRDEIGTDFPDSEAAYLNAFEAALDISVEMLRARDDPSQHRFVIRNDKDELLFDLPFAEVLRPAERVRPATEVYASLLRHHDRTQKVRSELRAQLTQACSLLQSTRALLANAPV
jgi:hypothetical protein